MGRLVKMLFKIMKIENKIERLFSVSVIPLILILLVGFLLRFYFTPFDLPSRSQDAFVFLLTALSFQNGVIDGPYFMWGGLLSFIFTPFTFENYDGYFTIIRLVATSISCLSGILVYLIAKEVMDKKFALLAMAFFVIEPNLIENSIFGMTEPLFIMLGLASFYFAIQKNNKFILLSFIIAGLAFDTRPNGLVLLIVVIFATYFQIKSKKQFGKIFGIGIALFLISSAPATLIFTDRASETLTLLNPNTNQNTPSFEQVSFISENKYLVASVTEIIHLFRITVPYLAIFVPFGFVVSLTKLNWQTKLIMISILASLVIAIPQYTSSVEYRNLFFITPFFCVFAAIGLEHLISDKKIKNIILIMIIIGLLLVSFNFLRERQPDQELIIEKEEFGKFVVSNFQGKITATNWNYIFHNIEYTIGKSLSESISKASIILKTPNFVIHNQNELAEFIQTNRIDYLIIDDEENIRLPISLDVYFNEEKYPFLKKVFDSDNHDYQKYRVKIFEVNYSKLE